MARYNYSPPSDWSKFEELICDVWSRELNDSDMQRFGRQGQSQNGVDIYSPKEGVGIQCKLKGIGEKISEDELKIEIDKAKKFKPKLKSFCIITTAKEDAKIQELAWEISDIHKKRNLFTISIFGWNTVTQRLELQPEVLEKYYPGASLNLQTIKDSLKATSDTNKIEHSELKEEVAHIGNKIGSQISNLQGLVLDIDNEYHKEIDYSRELLHQSKPHSAIEILKKLKDRVWQTANDKIKFRILTNIGSGKLSLGQEKEAAEYFLQAFPFNKTDEKALNNLALGYFILDSVKEAEKALNEIILADSNNSRAYALMTEVLSKQGVSFSNIQKRVPTHLQKSKDILFAFAVIANRLKDYGNAESFLKESLNTKNNAQKEELLGTVILAGMMQKPNVSEGILDVVSVEKLTEAFCFLNSAWNVYKNSEIKEEKIACLANMAIVKSLLGKDDEAKDILTPAAQDYETNADLNRNLGIICLKLGDFNNAIKYFDRLKATCDDIVTDYYLGISYLGLQNLPSSQKYLTQFIERGQEFVPEKESVITMLLDIFLKQSNPTGVSGLLNNKSISKQFKSLLDAKILKYKGEREKAVSILKTINVNAEEPKNRFIIKQLAEEFYSFGCFAEACNLYERIVDININNYASRKLVVAYYYAGNLKMALEASKSLRTRYGILEQVAKIEIAIYEDELDDLSTARSLYEKYLEKYPTDVNTCLRYIHLNMRMMEEEKVDDLLTKFENKHKLDTLGIDSWFTYCSLLAIRGQVEKAVRFMYEVLRNNYRNQKAHLKYMSLLLFCSGEDDLQILNTKEVAVDTAICYENEEGGKEWKLIVGKPDSQCIGAELSSSHELAQELLGKKVGDKFTLIKSGFREEFGTIKEIKHKYLYALHNSMADFEKLFPGQKALHSIKLSQKKSGEPTPSIDIKPIFNLVDKRHKNISTALDIYRNGQFTIGMLSDVLKINPIECYVGLINNPGVGVRSYDGNPAGITNAQKILEEKPKLVIDITTLIIAQRLELGQILQSVFGKMGVSQSALDILNESIEEKRALLRRGVGYSVLAKEQSGYVNYNVNRNQLQGSIDFLLSLRQFIIQYCEIIPCFKALDMLRAERDRREEALGGMFHDGLLIASDNGTAYYTEDLLLRAVGQNEYGVQGIWTQPILMFLKQQGTIDSERYSNLIIELVKTNHKHTSINADILFFALTKGGSSIDESFEAVCNILNGYNANEDSAVKVATEFIIRLWKGNFLDITKNSILVGILSKLISFRIKQRNVVKKLQDMLKIKLRGELLTQNDINKTISGWANTQKLLY